MESTQGTIVIVGATSSIAEQCARLWLQRGAMHLVLVGRDAGRTEHLAADLRVRGPQARIDVVAANLLDPAAIRSTVTALLATGNVPAAVLIAHGSLPDQAACQQDLVAAARKAAPSVLLEFPAAGGHAGFRHPWLAERLLRFFAE